MTKRQTETAIIGGGAAGIAAAHKLTAHGVDCLIVEARSRLGGRAYTVNAAGHPLDLGCGWLHSADLNPWSGIATTQGREFNKTLPPWERASMTHIWPLASQEEFGKAMSAFYARMARGTKDGHDTVASDFLEPGNPWNAMLNTVATFISGAEFDRMSAIDFERYSDSEINWRLFDGYGAMIAAHGDGLAVAFDSEVTRIDYRGKRLRIETVKGVIEADTAIITLPTSILGEREELFLPALPAKTNAARRLPLGHDDKLFIALDNAEEFEAESRVFGRLDREGTGNYHFRPFGRPLIEAYFGGRRAEELEADGEAAFFDFAVSELTGLFGADFRKRIKPVIVHPWGTDRFARGAYSYAIPGAAGERAVLVEPVDSRLFFAGEACSPFDFSTAHGAFTTGVEAADLVIAARDS